MSVCQACGAFLPPKTWQGRDRKWCSERCRKSQYDLVCVDCGGRVDGTTPGRMANPREPRCRKCASAVRSVWTAEAILRAIEEWACDNGGVPPVASDWIRGADTHPAASYVQRVFGLWSAAIRAAGYEPFRRGHYGRPGEDPAFRREVVGLYRSGLSIRQVAKTIGYSARGVSLILAREGEPRRYRGRPRIEVAA